MEVELNGELIAEYLEQRELYGVANMIRRQGERREPEGPQPTTYLGLAIAAPVERGHERPCITGATEQPMLPLRLPTNSPWASDPCGTEPPLGFSIDELPALGGASEPIGTGVEISEAVQGGREGDANGEQ
jgi:hypothetical protein